MGLAGHLCNRAIETKMEGELGKIEKFRGFENWGSWKFQIKVLIAAGDADDIISGTYVKPELVQDANAETRAIDIFYFYTFT